MTFRGDRYVKLPDSEDVAESVRHFARSLDHPYSMDERMVKRLMVQEMRPELVDLLPVWEGSPYRVLDVGAGPASTVGTMIGGKSIVRLAAVDALAGPYNEMLAARGIDPPAPTTFAVAEALDLSFPEDFFDMVHCENGVDHFHNPLEAIRQMIRVVKPECWVHLEMYERSGSGSGPTDVFHQHDFWLDGVDSRPIFQSRGDDLIDLRNIIGATLEWRTSMRKNGRGSLPVVVIQIRKRKV